MQGIALPYIKLHYIALNCITVQCNARTAVHCTALHYIIVIVQLISQYYASYLVLKIIAQFPRNSTIICFKSELTAC